MLILTEPFPHRSPFSFYSLDMRLRLSKLGFGYLKLFSSSTTKQLLMLLVKGQLRVFKNLRCSIKCGSVKYFRYTVTCDSSNLLLKKQQVGELTPHVMAWSNLVLKRGGRLDLLVFVDKSLQIT